MKISREELIEKVHKFIDLYYNKELTTAYNEDKPLIINIDKMELLNDISRTKPLEFIDLFKETISERVDKPIDIRFVSNELVSIRDLRMKHLNKFINIEGIVRRAGEIRPEVYSIIFNCDECTQAFEIPCLNSRMPDITECKKCGGKYQIEKKMVDVRWITLDEPFELAEAGRPSQINVMLSKTLVLPEGRRMTDPGNRLKLSGILREISKGKSAKLDFYLECNHVEPTEHGWHNLEINQVEEEAICKLAEKDTIYEQLIDSVAPSLYGMREIKEAVLLQMFGGVPKTMRDGINFRGDIHVLLIGDPSSGKSQLLKLIPKIVPRGKYVSGKGATTAGLTATVVKDEQLTGGWVLEAGALVLANGGLLSIDEFEKMTDDDQVAFHEAMEQGTVSIAKASIVATLPAQTSILAGGNPKFTRFDPFAPIAKQIDIPDTLLTRFDLKYAIRDLPDAGKDNCIVDHVLKTRRKKDEPIVDILEPSFMRKYIAYCRRVCHPELTDEASELLKQFYMIMRKSSDDGGSNGPVSITLRQFEALIRLSEASAKIQLSPMVRRKDAERAIKMMKFSLSQLGVDPGTGRVDIDKSDGAKIDSSERTQIGSIIEIIDNLSQKSKDVPVNEIMMLATKNGYQASKVEQIIEKLRMGGIIYEPTPMMIRKVQ
jgi:replicative DNA helicase Mcm